MIRLILISCLCTLAYTNNIGHRLGGDIYSPENTLLVYEKLQNHMHKVKFVEFDVRETKDHKLVVFHDTNINRMIPKTTHNKKIIKNENFKKIGIRHLTLEQITKLALENNASIPTLEAVLETSVEWGIQKPIHIEVKSLYSDTARYKIIETVSKYTEKLSVLFIGSSANLSKSFPYFNRWLDLLMKHNLKIYQIDPYDLTKVYQKYKNTLQYSPLLEERPFSIVNNNRRKITYPFVVPKDIETLLIGVYHGKDDSGDRGVGIKVIDSKDRELFSSFSNQKTWEWFTVQHRKDENLKICVEDNDTKMVGRYPGNAGKIKVIGILK